MVYTLGTGKMRIGFISYGDPNKNGTWSGIIHSTFEKLSEEHDVEWLDPNGLNLKLIRLIHAPIRIVTRRPLRSYHTRSFASALNRNLQRYDLTKYDLLFSIGSSEIAFLRTDVPIVHLTDATYAQMVGYYDGFDMGVRRNRDADMIQRKAYDVSTQLILMSHWTAISAMNDYDVPEEKINVLRFGANQDVPDRLLERHRCGKLRLLFVGKEWKRKGGQIAVDALNALRSRGIDAELTMVGCDPPKDLLSTPHVVVHPFVANVAPFFRGADVLILPTRAECAGIVFCEASAYGLPSFTTATGGVPDYVEDDINGRLLSLDAMGDDYADAIAELWNDQEGFKAMRLSARRRYEEELNWDVWMQHFERIAQKALTESKE